MTSRALHEVTHALMDPNVSPLSVAERTPCGARRRAGWPRRRGPTGRALAPSPSPGRLRTRPAGAG
ncbi:hypothetical protein ACFQY5_18495 [Paeniroseomonas aquatica]|uniref:hypothetical protein n=1 Tax=Paeniroseomonas aquatica TaxID=373043 RepID=UPI00360E07D2